MGLSRSCCLSACAEEHNCSGEQSLATDAVGCLVQCKVAISIVEQWGRVEEVRGREEGEKEGGKKDGSKKESQMTFTQQGRLLLRGSPVSL